MKSYRMEDMKIHYRVGRSIPTRQYEITRIGTRRPIYEFSESYQTNIGALSPNRWYEILQNCIRESRSEELLSRIIDHCKLKCVWLKTDKDREEYAMDILAGRIYRKWRDFPLSGLVENTAFVFEFK